MKFYILTCASFNMKPYANYVFFSFCILFLILLFGLSQSEKVKLFSPERPVVEYYNRKYVSYVNATALRSGRKNPVYYGSVHVQSTVAVDNNVTLSLYFYTYAGNHRYHRFIDLHYKFCDLVKKDQFIGPMLRQGKLLKPCPFPADDYHVSNMSLRQDAIPSFIPQSKGRVFVNVTVTKTGEPIASGYVDIEIREINRN